jgi:linoleoyl-CoA desaturase
MADVIIDTSLASRHKPWLDDFGSLRREVKRRGLYKRNDALLVSHLCVHMALAILGLAVLTFCPVLLVKVAACGIALLGLLGVATHTHNSAHYLSTTNPRFDAILSYIGYSVTFGVSVAFWQHKHHVHHRNPNILGIDQDFAFMPLFAVTDQEKAAAVKASRLSRFYYKYVQSVLVPVLVSLNVTNMQKNGIVFLIRQIRSRQQSRRAHWIDLACCGLHFVLWLVIPCIWVNGTTVLLFYVIHNIVLSYVLFLVLGSSHLPRSAACARTPHSDIVLKQTATTLNIRSGMYGRFLLSGLDYQIEHHLFPGVSYHNLPKVSELVREYCDHHGYPHQTFGMLKAALGTIFIFYQPKQLLDHLDKHSSMKIARG